LHAALCSKTSKLYFCEKDDLIMFKLGKTHTLIASCVLAIASMQAMAQNAPASPAGPAQKQEQMHKRHQDHMQKRMGELKAKLALRADQEASWSQWQADLQSGMQHRPEHDRRAMDKLTTPERIDRMQAMHAERSQHMQKVAQSTKQFYAKLDAVQQKTFDEQSARHMRGGMREHGRDKHHG
jgi:periplasmic protein CpxP/Spy